MSSAISEFAKTGEINFAKIAVDFASMIADMTAKWAVAAALKAALNAISGGLGGGLGGGSGMTFGLPPSEGSPAPSGGMRAAGGPVLPGYGYTVGEQGPERFVPAVAGTIVADGQRDAARITINNNAPATDVQAQQRPDGSIEVTVDRVRKALTRDVMRGGNGFAQAMERTYRVSRAGV
jgi:phage-related minor tail protein